MSKKANGADKLKIAEAFRAGYFARGAANPNIWSSTMWEAWEIGKHFQQKGLGYFSISKTRGSSYKVEDGRTASILYGKKGAFVIGIEERLI